MSPDKQSRFSEWYAKHGKQKEEEPERNGHERIEREKERIRKEEKEEAEKAWKEREEKHKLHSFKARTADREEPKENKRYVPGYGKKTEGQAEYDKATKIEEKQRFKQTQKEERYEKRYAKVRSKLEEARGMPEQRIIALKRKLKHEKEMNRKLSPVGQAYAKAKKSAKEITESNKEFLKGMQESRYKYRSQMQVDDRKKRPRTNKARQFAKAQQSNQTYRPALSDPFDLNPKKDIDFFGQPREYNLVGENKKYDLGFGTEKKHDLGIGKKYDLGIGSKKELDLFGNGNGKKKKNDKFW
jgi:hypothetical protein